MSDQFRISQEVVEEDVNDALGPQAMTIDPEHPGFASLLEVMQGGREGRVERDVLVAYFQGLRVQLEQARAAIDAMPVPEEVADKVAPAVEATRSMLGDMGEVVNLFGDWLASGNEEYIERAISMLEAVHHEIRAAASVVMPPC